VAIKDRITGRYKCSYCSKDFLTPAEADACRDEHDLLYVQISKQDLNRLIMFLQLKDDSLLTKTLLHSLYKYRAIGSEE
jgi:hypothetical protein